MTLEIWAIVAVVLILMELLAPGLILVFFGMAGLTVAAFMALGLIESQSAQWTTFGLASVIYLFTLRGVFKRWLRGRRADTADGSGIVDEIEGQRVVVVADFEAGRGKVELNGVHWEAESAEDLASGDRAVITGKHGIRLRVDRL